MDRIQFKLRLKPELVKKLKELHPSYGELSRVVGEMLELYVVAKTTKERSQMVEDICKCGHHFNNHISEQDNEGYLLADARCESLGCSCLDYNERRPTTDYAHVDEEDQS